MRLLLCAAVLLTALSARAEGPPERVVSMNLCTDQLALLVGAPGQVVSVSNWARMPSASNMVAATEGLEANAAHAEEVFLLAPDLVLASAYTNRASVEMLRRLGMRVEIFEPTTSIGAIRSDLQRMGRLLGREAEAARQVAALDRRLTRLAALAARTDREAAAFQFPNGYTAGAGTLAAEVLDRAGLDNVAEAAGLRGAARLPLEVLVTLRPFLVRTEHISGAETGRAFELARHPALAGLDGGLRGARLPERLLACGTPFTLDAIATLIDARLPEDGE